MTEAEMNHLEERRDDAKYFIIVPQLVWALSQDPYDLVLWVVVKMVAGEDGECYLSTRQLAKMAMMSSGKVVECRKRLLIAGLLEGEVRQDPGWPQPVWHLRVPDLWRRNVEWREVHHSIDQRLEFKESVHQVNTPEERSPGEQGYPPGEPKDIHQGHPSDDDDAHSLEEVISALLERHWNAGEVQAAQFAEKHGLTYTLEICSHAREHGLYAGWIRKNAGSWRPSENGDGEARTVSAEIRKHPEIYGGVG